MLIGKIICFLGLFGVGKISIGCFIVCVFDCKFFWFFVGGLFDVVEINVILYVKVLMF